MRTVLRALTLVELVIVLLILVAVASLVLPTISGTIERSKDRAAYLKLVSIREAILGTPSRPGFRSHLPQSNAAFRLSRLHQLYRNDGPSPFPSYQAATRTGWSGPYLDPATSAPYVIDDPRGFSSEYGAAGELAPLDLFSVPAQPSFIVLQDRGAGYEARLVSPGPNRRLECDPNITTAAALMVRGDDIVVFLDVADPLAKDFLN